MNPSNDKKLLKKNSGGPLKGEQLKALPNSVLEKLNHDAEPTKPQADETLNLGLTSQNDI